MLLTATCTRPEVDEIRKNLTIEENNFVLVRDSASHRPEINFNVRERKEIKDQYIIDVINIINAHLHGHIIIYCATHFICEYLHNKLWEKLPNISIDYFHGGLRDDERETAINNWKSNNTQVIVATSAFGMGINSNNIRAVIHIGAPMSISMYANYLLVIIIIFSLYLFCAIIANLIQEAGRAGRDGNTATHFIFLVKRISVQIIL